MAKLTQTDHLYVRSMGKLLRVTAVFATDDEANSYMEAHPDDAVVSCAGGIVFLANCYDSGEKLALAS